MEGGGRDSEGESAPKPCADANGNVQKWSTPDCIIDMDLDNVDWSYVDPTKFPLETIITVGLLYLVFTLKLNRF